jgi:pilus assembly protein Flp/PilA
MLTQFNFIATWLKARINDDRGASLVEYALLVALIAVVCIAAVTFLGEAASSNFQEVGDSIGT